MHRLRLPLFLGLVLAVGATPLARGQEGLYGLDPIKKADSDNKQDKVKSNNDDGHRKHWWSLPHLRHKKHDGDSDARKTAASASSKPAAAKPANKTVPAKPVSKTADAARPSQKAVAKTGQSARAAAGTNPGRKSVARTNQGKKTVRHTCSAEEMKKGGCQTEKAHSAKTVKAAGLR